jgi:hypothetical protein
MTRYLNMRTASGVETVDELNRDDFNSHKEFRKELRRLVGEYHLCGMGVYISQRCTKEWGQ